MKWVTAILAILVLGLVGLGIAVQASISNVQGIILNGNPHHFLIQQVLYFLIALVCCMVVAAIKPDFWSRTQVAYFLCFCVLLALLSVHVPGIGRTTNGSTRWIYLFGVSLQPSEFVKLMAILLMAWWQSRPECRNDDFKQGALFPFIGLGVVAGGFFSQPDYGSIVMLGAVNVPILIAAGARIKHVLPFAVLAFLLLAVLIFFDPERRSRVTAVFRGNSVEATVSDDDTYQLEQSRAAIKAGGLYGTGFGSSVFKQNYLPENHTDFVYAMICEELGFVVAMPCIGLFLCLMWCGIWISLRAPTSFTRLLAFGMSLHIGLCAGVNLGVVTGALPTKGLALPFLSYGGSSLVSSMIAIGFIIAVGWRCPPAPRASRSHYDVDRRVWVS